MRTLAMVLVLAGTALASPSAEACFNVTQAEVDGQTKKLKKAETALEAEDHATAHRLATETIRFLDNAKRAVHPDGKLRSPENTPVNPPDANLLQRAHRIDALASSRAAKSTQADRDAAVKTFESLVLGPSSDPTVVADYAELLSRIPPRASQAAMMLRALHKKDLIGSPNAFLALARLEKAAGDSEAEKDARERCRTSATKKTICDS